MKYLYFILPAIEKKQIDGLREHKQIHDDHKENVTRLGYYKIIVNGSH